MVLSVLIVDDERWMRDTIAKSIDWEQYGLRVVGKASDGLQAHDMIMALKPDIVLADIKMPGMDGITLLRRLRENGMEPVFIFFSGYDSFQYAKDAINLGAMGYISKPVDERELLKTVLKAKEHIKYERENIEEKMHFADLSVREKDRRKTEYIERLLDGTAFEENYSQIPLLDFVSDCFMVIAVEIDRYGELQRTSADKCPQLKLALGTICMDFFEINNTNVFPVNTKNGVVIVLNTNELSGDGYYKTLSETCERLIKVFKLNMGSSITIGIGFPVTGKERIHETYKASVKALEYKLLAGMGRVIGFRDIFKSKISTVILDDKLEKSIVAGFEIYDFKLTDRIIEYVKALMNTTRLSIDDIKTFNYSLIELVYRLMNKAGIQTGNYCSNPHLVYDEMNRCEDMEELFGKYSVLINESMQMLTDRGLNYYKKLADSVKRYIHEHYSENIGLESVSGALAFHPNYISRIFKEEFGVNFIDYLTDYRITEAKELLRGDVKHNVSEIAGMVGYNNAKYFSKVFKKTVGVTPAEYIEKNR